jgi:hypothetical protein
VWNVQLHKIVEPNGDEQERAMEFVIGITSIHGNMEFQHCFLLGQTMDFNFLSWAVSLVVAKQI